MQRLVLALVLAHGALVGGARAQTIPYNDCGTLVPGVTCPILFRDSANLLWNLSNTGGFQLGDVVRVVGAADPGCFTICMQGGCIQVSTITTCVTSVGTPYCPGDGSGTACPCANHSPVGSDTGCLHSLGIGGALRATGAASVSADTVVLQGSQMPNGPTLYFQGTLRQNGGAGSAFGDGLLCAGGTLIRLGVKFNAGGASQWPEAGDPPISLAGLVAPGDVRDYQSWYRDAAAYCTISTFDLTNGLEIPWGT